jgi:hypothetical protein
MSGGDAAYSGPESYSGLMIMKIRTPNEDPRMAFVNITADQESATFDILEPSGSLGIKYDGDQRGAVLKLIRNTVEEEDDEDEEEEDDEEEGGYCVDECGESYYGVNLDDLLDTDDKDE